jgi:hypothetical protein
MKIKTVVLGLLLPFLVKSQSTLPDEAPTKTPFFYSSFEDALLHKEKATHLNQRNKDLDEIPENIHLLTKLQVYTVMKNSIKTINPTLFECKELKELIFRNNQITELPEKLGSLSKLSYLNAAHNKLNALPSSLGNLKLLKILLYDLTYKLYN